MARIRTIKPDFFFDSDLAELDYSVRLFFIGLWTQADRAGRGEDCPKKLKAMIFPYDGVDGDQCMKLLAQHFITRYEANGKRYFQINNFLKHQYPHVKEAESTIPPPTKSASTIQAPYNNHTSTLDNGKGKEGKGMDLARNKSRTKESSKMEEKHSQPFRDFMNKFLAEMLDLVPDGTERRRWAIQAAYRRYARAGRDILALAEGDPGVAFDGVKAVGLWLQDRGLSWTLDTAAKHFLDWKMDPKGFGNAKGKKD